MRFVIGLLSGAAAILLLAQMSGAPDGRWQERLPVWFDAAATTLGDVLALPPRPPTPTPPPPRSAVAAADADLEGPLPAGEPIPLPPEPRPVDLHEDQVVAPAPGRVAVSDAEPGAEAGPVAVGDIDAVARSGAGAADAAAIAAEIFGPRGVPAGKADRAASATAAGRQTVWVPFHSRMSADGFAERLSDSLDHPFLVERQGPGRYQVVFGYRDEPQREALLAQAAELTGLRL